MALTDERLLIIITGPVGGGKSTTSLALAQSLRRHDYDVAVIDLDEMYIFVRQQDGYGEPTARTRARHGTAALVNALFNTDVAIVIVEGEFFNAEELGAVTTLVHANIACCFFTLQLSYEHALKRVQGDPSRSASKDPPLLKSLHVNFA